MGAGNSAPAYYGTNQGMGDLPNSEAVMKATMTKLNNGFSEDTINKFNKTQKAFGENVQGQIGSNLVQGTQSLDESMAQTGGNMPVDALLKGKVALQSGANGALVDMNDKLGERDFQFAMEGEKGKAQAFGDYANLLQLALGAQDRKNQYITHWSDSTNDSKFNVGKLIGSLIGGASQVASARLGRG